MVLPVSPVESAPFPYSTQIDPAPSVIESGAVALTAAPVAKVELVAVGAACAETRGCREEYSGRYRQAAVCHGGSPRLELRITDAVDECKQLA